MKKEYWLYIIIVILAIWIIASYMSAPKTEAPTTINGTTQADTVVPSVENSPSETVVSVPSSNAVTIDNVLESGMPAGPNKGVIAGTVAPTLASISVSNQTAGSMASVANVDMPIDGWVVIHETDALGNPGWILGAQRFDKGSYAGGQVELLRSMVAGGKYFAMIHSDNGDKVFDLKADLPYEQNGAPVSTYFLAQ